jgi:Rad3-related DNA helicase
MTGFLRVGGKMAVWDIEEAVKEGAKHTVCPFHMAQDQIQEGAGLVFITYQQLLDPIIRRAGGMDKVLEDAVVLVDEAHNLPQVARDAASYELTEDRLADLVATLRNFIPHLHVTKKQSCFQNNIVRNTPRPSR